MPLIFSSPTARRLSALALALPLIALLALPAVAQEGDSAADAEQSPFYSLGLIISQQLGSLAPSEAELDEVVKGVRDGATGKVAVDARALMPQVQALATERAKIVSDKERAAGAEFAAKKKEEALAAGGEVTESGLIFKSLRAGDGESPAETDQVKVHYHGTLRTGEVFDSSVERNQPATFGLNQVIKCWTEGVQKMKVGGKAELVCPPDIAYGDRATGTGVGAQGYVASQSVSVPAAVALARANETERTTVGRLPSPAANNDSLVRAPEIFQASTIALWDGRRTARGVWVA
ncbi:MAG: FKBP-type peptidyl-prolyl cis-trans isomerase, partial [Acidobacteriota bacterium]